MKQVDGDAARIQIWWNAMSNQITVSFLILDLENGNKFSTLYSYYSYFQCLELCVKTKTERCGVVHLLFLSS